MENRPPQQETPKQPTDQRAEDERFRRVADAPLALVALARGFCPDLLAVRAQERGPGSLLPLVLRQVQADNIKSISIQGDEIRGELRKDDYVESGDGDEHQVRKFITYMPPRAGDADRSKAHRHDKAKKTVEGKGSTRTTKRPRRRQDRPIPANSASSLAWILFLLPTFVVLGFFYLMMRRARDQFDGGILGSFVKSPAKRHDKSKQRTTFDEVAGLENAKSELQEIVEFLKNPEKFQRLGGRIPKGVLLNGPPGTGKTLLARAVAGEAGVPFFSISGSEFIQMFVGVGASRVRDMFKTAKENSPCILFIDEIDAVGRVRGAGLGGGHDEREQTLNQILTEMDGFSPSESVIVLAATNRPDVLDPALLRPGRFDRHVTVDRPTKKGRLEILKVHIAERPAGDRRRPGNDRPEHRRHERCRSGEPGQRGGPAGHSRRQGGPRLADFDAALDKIIMGAKREDVITEKEKRATAYHEVGHTLVGWFTAMADPVHKVTIIPRGRALGVTQTLPDEDRISYYESQIKAMLDSFMGGRAAERLVFEDLSTGVADDLKRATRLARVMVTQCGMSERVGPVFFRDSEEHPFLGREMSETRDHSEHTRPVDRRRSRPHPARGRRSRLPHARRAPRRAGTPDRGPDRARGPVRGAEIEELIGKRPTDDRRTVEVDPARDDEIVASIDNPS